MTLGFNGVKTRPMKKSDLDHDIEKKDKEMIFDKLKYLEFEYILKKYGYKGVFKVKQLEEIASNKKNFFGITTFKINSLTEPTNRIYSYMNNELVMVKDIGQYS